jgi:hypothetical protein
MQAAALDRPQCSQQPQLLRSRSSSSSSSLMQGLPLLQQQQQEGYQVLLLLLLPQSRTSRSSSSSSMAGWRAPGTALAALHLLHLQTQMRSWSASQRSTNRGTAQVARHLHLSLMHMWLTALRR